MGEGVGAAGVDSLRRLVEGAEGEEGCECEGLTLRRPEGDEGGTRRSCVGIASQVGTSECLGTFNVDEAEREERRC